MSLFLGVSPPRRPFWVGLGCQDGGLTSALKTQALRLHERLAEPQEPTGRRQAQQDERAQCPQLRVVVLEGLCQGQGGAEGLLALLGGRPGSLTAAAVQPDSCLQL